MAERLVLDASAAANVVLRTEQAPRLIGEIEAAARFRLLTASLRRATCSRKRFRQQWTSEGASCIRSRISRWSSPERRQP